MEVPVEQSGLLDHLYLVGAIAIGAICNRHVEDR